jgi:hypothetical protein
VACAPKSDNKSVTSDGYCTSSYGDAYNSVVQKLDFLAIILKSSLRSGEYVESHLQDADTACRNFYRKHGGVACKGRVDGVVKYVSGNDFKAQCDDVRSYFENAAEKQTPQAPSYSPSLPAIPDVPAVPVVPAAPNTDHIPKHDDESQSKLENISAAKIEFVVQEPEILSAVFSPVSTDKDGHPQVENPSEVKALVNGKVKTSEEASVEVSTGKAFCMIRNANEIAWLKEKTKKGNTLKVTDKDEGLMEGHRYVGFILDDGSLVMKCMKLSSSEITIGEVSEALGTVLVMRIKE